MMLEALLEENNIEMEKNDIRTVKNYIDAGSGLPDSQDGYSASHHDLFVVGLYHSHTLSLCLSVSLDMNIGWNS